ncbi:hypothetical protein [Demequina sp. NBRC 110055]|uniref:hypothetical protein n=1 Tax=Demequina sp. NBRC 110055 TaxID=1570344 RepID=UPI0009FD8366|nr:hypothetical protein [Demequina sp. NBRC 110055]
MLAGTTIGRRFTLLHPVRHDLAGIERWVADDTRLAQRVNLDILTSARADAARNAAASIAKVRDARFPRVLSSGIHRDDDGNATYIVTERPRGTQASTLVGADPLTPAAAATLVGEAARALEVAALEGVHHGHLRPAALMVTPSGRVLVTGLGVDGVIGRDTSAAPTEAGDAAALAAIYARAVTGADAATLTAADVPEGLGSAGTSLVLAVIAGDPPTTLAEISRTMGTADARALRAAASGQRASAPSPTTPSPATPPSVPTPVSAPTPPSAASPSAPATAPSTEAAAPATASPEPATASAPGHAPAEERIEPHPKDAPLEMLDEIVADQHARRAGGVWQILLSRLHGWFPRSQSVTSALERARERANQPAPFNAGPLILGLAVVAIIVIAIVAFSTLTTITAPEGYVPSSPSPAYPEFTFSPEPSPSASDEG